MKMKNAVTYGSVFVLLSALALPISAGAFGRSPSESEVLKQPAAMGSAKSIADTAGEVSAQKVPEPSSLLLVGVALGVWALVSMRKLVRQAIKK